MSCPIRSVSEVALWVEDVERAARFYRDALGFTLESLDPGRNAFLRAGDFLLVVFNPRDPGTPLAAGYLQRTGGPRGDVYHVAFRTEPEDLDAYATRLRAMGLEVSGPVDFATGRRSYFVEDPDQHYIEITDR
jgi:catechol 2,3-dioxygenase-like lactoylglutathione lyase family enzyme